MWIKERFKQVSLQNLCLRESTKMPSNKDKTPRVKWETPAQLHATNQAMTPQGPSLRLELTGLNALGGTVNSLSSQNTCSNPYPAKPDYVTGGK